MKILNKFICIAIIMIFTLSFGKAYAETDFGTRPSSDFEIKITNLNEPTIGAKPSFDFDYGYSSSTQYRMEYMEFEYWLEFDESYEDMLDYMNDVNYMYEVEDYFDLVKGVSVNPEFGDHIGGPIPKIRKFKANKTYMAVFYAGFSYDPYYPYVNDDGIISKRRKVTKDISHVATKVPESIQIEDYIPDQTYEFEELPDYLTVVSSVNNKTSNVKTIIEERLTDEGKAVPSAFEVASVNVLSSGTSQGEEARTEGVTVSPNMVFDAMVLALYTTEPAKENFKATVNWIDAPEDQIPDILTLKLMNGSTVVKEDTVKKSDMENKTSWTHDFGEYPVTDESGKEINYTLTYSGDLTGYTTMVNDFVINNTYIPPTINSKIRMVPNVNREKNNVKYKINYTASIKKYSGDAYITITAVLPFAIDESKSDLDGGIYDPDTKTVTWEDAVKDINKSYNYSNTKNIDLYPTAVLPYAIEAKATGKIKLGESDKNIYSVDTLSSSTGNPKTDDIIKKYVSIGLVGLASIFMVVSIKRKYSTKKSKVQF